HNLFGTNFNDQLIGDSNSNVLDGGYGGDDKLTGNNGADTFVVHGGHLTITDFSHSSGDKLDITGLGLSEADLDVLIMAAAPGSDTIRYGDGNAITLSGVDVHSLNTVAADPNSDFLYKLVISTADQQIAENGGSSTLSGLSIIESFAGDNLTLSASALHGTVSPASGSGNASDVNTVL